MPDGINSIDNVEGLTFNGITEHNGHRAAEITMESGGYIFNISNGTINASVDSKYTVDNEMSVRNV